MALESKEELLEKLKAKLGDDDFVWWLFQLLDNLDDMDKWLVKYDLDKKKR